MTKYSIETIMGSFLCILTKMYIFFFILGIILLEELGDLILNHVTQTREHLQSILYVLLRYLHRIGVIIWYEDIDVLSDRVFIHPSFLISMFKVSNGFSFPLEYM